MAELTSIGRSSHQSTEPCLPSFWGRLLIKIKFLFTNTSPLKEISESFSKPHGYEGYINPLLIRANEKENQNFEVLQRALQKNPTYCALKQEVQAIDHAFAQNETKHNATLSELQRSTDLEDRKLLFRDDSHLLVNRSELKHRRGEVVSQMAAIERQTADELKASDQFIPMFQTVPRYNEVSSELQQSVTVYQSIADQVFEFVAQNPQYTIGQVISLSLPLYLSSVEEDNIRSFLSQKALDRQFA